MTDKKGNTGFREREGMLAICVPPDYIKACLQSDAYANYTSVEVISKVTTDGFEKDL